MRTTSQYPQYAPIEKQIAAYRLGRTIDIAERLADAIVGIVKELQAPPRPAYIVVAERDSKLGGEVQNRFLPRYGFE
jgi:hypothetical protein